MFTRVSQAMPGYSSDDESSLNTSNLVAGKKRKKDWSDDETLVLIDLWEENELLYNVKNPMCFNKDERNKCFEKISKSLEEKNIFYTAKEISDKISKLRNYYGAQQRLVETSKKLSINEEDHFVSKWKFFQKLEFLKNNIQPRSMKMALPLETKSVKTSENGSPTSEIKPKPASIKYVKKVKTENQSNNVENIMESALHRLKSINHQSSANGASESQDKTQDQVFCDLISKMLSEIPSCSEKDFLKLDIQHKILNLKYQKMADDVDCNSHTEVYQVYDTRPIVYASTYESAPTMIREDDITSSQHYISTPVFSSDKNKTSRPDSTQSASSFSSENI